MSITPNKHLFIVTSTLNANMGVFDYETRIRQTVDTLRILREKVPEAIIVLTDSSPNNVDDSILGRLSKYSNLNIVSNQYLHTASLA